MEYRYVHLKSADVEAFRQLMVLFGEVFEEEKNYTGNPPSDKYISEYLGKDSHIILTVQLGDKVVGGLAAYVLEKFEQERKTIFVYDLAISPEHQRKGLATGLFVALKDYATKNGIYETFVEAEDEDEIACAFYRSLNADEEIVAHHFTIKY